MFVQLWMATDLITVKPDQTLTEAENLLNHHTIRRLPVVENGQLIGIITQANIDQGLPSITAPENATRRDEVAKNTLVRAMMTSNPITISPQDTLERAAYVMRKNKIGGLPVVENEQLVGILSESNALDALLEVLGFFEHCARIELKISHAPEAFYELFEILQDYRMDILSLAMHKNFSPEHRLVTIRVKGPKLDDMIDELWESDFLVTRVLREDNEQPM